MCENVLPISSLLNIIVAACECLHLATRGHLIPVT